MVNIKDTLRIVRKYANVKIIDTNVQIELKNNIQVNMIYIQKLVNDLKENKAEVILVLESYKNKDYLEDVKYHALNKGYFMNNKIYGKQLTKNSYVFVQFVNDLWESYRITYNNNSIKSEMTIAEDIDLMNLINITEKYIECNLNHLS